MDIYVISSACDGKNDSKRTNSKPDFEHRAIKPGRRNSWAKDVLEVPINMLESFISEMKGMNRAIIIFVFQLNHNITVKFS